jgi:hypothetical protein
MSFPAREKNWFREEAHDGETRALGAPRRSRHDDPIHGGRQIGPPLFYRILEQIGIDELEFEGLR